MANTPDLWFRENAADIFASAMSWNRFRFISKLITSDDGPTRNDQWKNGKYACMRELFKKLTVKNAKLRFPSSLLAIDEILYPYRGAIGFKQYNSNKLAKYGLLYHSLCDSSTSCTYFTLPYTGKSKEISGEAAKFNVTGTDEYTKYLVTEFNQYNSILGCKISMDWYFTSVTLAKWGLQNNFTIVGAMQHNRKYIPNYLKTLTLMDTDEKSTLSVYRHNKEMMLVSYISKKKSGKQNIIVLTTMHGKVKVTIDQRCKPHVLVIYDQTKEGVDVVDLISIHHLTRIKSK